MELLNRLRRVTMAPSKTESNANPIQKHRNIPLHTTLRDLNPPEREDHSFQDPSQIDKLAAFMTPSQTSLTNPASPNPNKPLPPAPAFNFLSLPPELRLCIYDLVLRGRDRDLEELSVIKMVGPNFFIGSHQPAFSRVCRQMREESLPMFYRGNAFHIDFGAPDVFYRQEHDMLSHWIGIIGDANASHLKTVIVASRVLHLKALTLECEAGQFPMGKGRLQMYQQGFQEAFRRHEYERREKSLWLMRTFLMNGFEVGEDALITGEVNVLEVADFVWQLQRKILACKHKLRDVDRNPFGPWSDWCEECGVYKHRRTEFAF